VASYSADVFVLLEIFVCYPSAMGNRLSKIVTKTGDRGTTGLADGSRVAKHSARIEAIGTLDELNSFVGLFIAELPSDNELSAIFARVQNDLFDVGGELAMSTSESQVQVLTEEHAARLEKVLEELNEQLPPLKNFILPGGSRLLASCHLVRSIARRAERDFSRLAAAEPVNRHSQVYLNRLSDLAFVSARWLARELQINEVLWQQNKPQK